MRVSFVFRLKQRPAHPLSIIAYYPIAAYVWAFAHVVLCLRMYSMHVYYKQNNRICEKEAFARMNECEWYRNRRRIHWAAATIVDAGLISASQHDVDLLRINENSALQCRKANTNGPNADPQVNKVGKKNALPHGWSSSAVFFSIRLLLQLLLSFPRGSEFVDKR